MATTPSDVFYLLAKLKVDTNEFKNGMEDAQKTFDGSKDKIKSGLGALKNGFDVLAGATAAALGAAATGIGAMVKQSVDAYGSYEQLAGGVQTLFGDSAQTVLANSEEAYRTAGMSMNEYMETSIQSAAALINSLSGDQAKAAELMDMSIIDMSDNVNKMGTTMQSVQDAYRGFSRGNFTMLDNLALGFSGTKEGMQELLDMAQQISGIEYDISSYSDIVQAIHVVQQQMGISGTTAAEAADTIQGSAGSMQAAWENLKVELVKDNGDIGNSIDILVNSATTMFDNIEPKIERAVGGVGTLVDKAAPILQKKLPEMINKVFPSLLSASGQLLGSVLTGVGNAVPALIDTGVHLLGEVSRAISRADFGGGEILTNIITKLADKLPEIVRYSSRIASSLGQAVMSLLPDLVSSLGDLFTSALHQLEIADLGALNGLRDSLLNIINVDNIKSAFDWLSENIFTPLIEWGTNDILPTVFDGLAASVDILTSALNFLETPAKAVWQEFLQPLAGIAGDVIYGTLDLISKGLQTVADTVDGVDWEGYWIDLFSGNFGEDWELGWADLKNNIEDCGDAIDEFFDTTEFTRSWNEFWQGVGAAIYDEFYNEKWLDFKENFILGWQSIADAVKGFADRVNDAINAVKTLLGIQEEIPIEETDSYKKSLEIGDKYDSWGNGDWGADYFTPNARGSIVTRPTRALIGEAGAEAVIPLEHQTQWIDKVAERINSAGNGGGGATYIFNFDGAYIGSKEMARELVQPMSEELQRLYNRGSRGLGGV